MVSERTNRRTKRGPPKKLNNAERRRTSHHCKKILGDGESDHWDNGRREGI